MENSFTHGEANALAARLDRLAGEFGGRHSVTGRELSLLALRARLLGTADTARYARSTGPRPRLYQSHSEITLCEECAGDHRRFLGFKHAAELAEGDLARETCFLERLPEPLAGSCSFCRDSDEVTHLVFVMTRSLRP